MHDDPELLAIFRAEVMEQLDALSSELGNPPEAWGIDGLFRLAHNVKGAARMVGATGVHDVAHVLEDLFGAFRSGLMRDPETVRLARDGIGHLDRARADEERGASTDVEAYRRAVANALRAAPRAPQAAPPTVAAERVVAEPAIAEPVVEHAAEHPPDALVDTTLRVTLDRVDALAELASELESTVDRSAYHRDRASAIAAKLLALAARAPELRRVPALADAIRGAQDLRDDLARHHARGKQSSLHLHERIRALRMVRVDSVGAMLRGVMREACRAARRQADLRIRGGQTEIDRVVLDRLRDPLVHLLRNAIAHGIEDAPTRARAGKPGTGRIELIATTAGPWVDLLITDDGGGIDPDALRAAAVARGLVDEAVARADSQATVLGYMFLPGFSTATDVSELAGRGVGLDVVRSNVAAIGGSVRVTSTLTEGTTFALRVPLTRLTTKGIVARIAGQRIAIPTSGVERTLRVEAREIRRIDNADTILVGGHIVPISSLATHLGFPMVPAAARPAIIVAVDGRRRAWLVDEIDGEREFVQQPPAWNLSGVKGLAGTAVLDGAEVLLVLGVDELCGITFERSASTAVRPSSEATQRRILVVDDSVTSRTLERNILANAGYAVTQAVNGKEALALVEQQPFDVIVTDVEMPLMDGIALTQAIRARPESRTLPVILVTSLGSEEHKRRGVEAGADAYIVKGAFDQDELLTTVARLV